MKKPLIALAALFILNSVNALEGVKELRVYKSERKLKIIGEDNQVLKTYNIMLGKNPIGHKKQEGDFRTPEGEYTLDAKNPNSNFHKAFHISYPNFNDRVRAKLDGVNPGGNIMLHGFPNGSIEAEIKGDWTEGCVAVTDYEIDELFDWIDVPTKIIITE